MVKRSVKELRESIGLSQGEFAKKFGIPKRTIENWEEGKSAPKGYVLTLIKMAIEKEKEV